MIVISDLWAILSVIITFTDFIPVTNFALPITPFDVLNQALEESNLFATLVIGFDGLNEFKIISSTFFGNNIHGSTFGSEQLTLSIRL